MKKINKDLFVPYSIALDLKKLGFDEACFSAYRNSDGEEMLMDVSSWTNSGTENNHEGYCAAPIYEQVIDWFLLTHNILISFNFENVYSKIIIYKVIHFKDGTFQKNDIYSCGTSFYIYQKNETYNKGILEAIKLIK